MLRCAAARMSQPFCQLLLCKSPPLGINPFLPARLSLCRCDWFMTVHRRTAQHHKALVHLLQVHMFYQPLPCSWHCEEQPAALQTQQYATFSQPVVSCHISHCDSLEPVNVHAHPCHITLVMSPPHFANAHCWALTVDTQTLSSEHVLGFQRLLP